MKCPLDFSDPMLNHVTYLVNLTLCTQDLGSETRQTLMPKMSQATGTPCEVSRILLKASYRHQSGNLNIFFCFPQKQNLIGDAGFFCQRNSGRLTDHAQYKRNVLIHNICSTLCMIMKFKTYFMILQIVIIDDFYSNDSFFPSYDRTM